MGSVDTMNLLSESFIQLAQHLPIEKISVSDIVTASKKNRKTFYYHFEGKEALIRWIFRKDLSGELLDNVDARFLVYEKQGEKTLSDLPYYVFEKIGVRSLDGSAFVHALGACLQGRRPYYAKVLKSTEAYSLRVYLRHLYVPMFEKDIRFILSNRYLPEANIKFLAEFYTGALLSYFIERICNPACIDPLANMTPFDNIIHSSLESEIKKQQLMRAL